MAQLQWMRQTLLEFNNTNTYGNYYRFFPNMIRQGARDWHGQWQIPRARGFGGNENPDKRELLI
jgi:hypothetical protein